LNNTCDVLSCIVLAMPVALLMPIAQQRKFQTSELALAQIQPGPHTFPLHFIPQPTNEAPLFPS
jgi:hypothetical protein